MICDAGIATAANIAWLTEQGYRYLVGSRERARPFNTEQALAFEAAGGETIRVQKVLGEDGQEVRLYGHSSGREQKKVAIVGRFVERFEPGLAKLAAALTKPRGERRYDKILERIGRLKEKSHGIGQHYEITVQADEAGKKATSITWHQEAKPSSMLTDPGVYCLRTNVPDTTGIIRHILMMTKHGGTVALPRLGLPAVRPRRAARPHRESGGADAPAPPTRTSPFRRRGTSYRLTVAARIACASRWGSSVPSRRRLPDASVISTASHPETLYSQPCGVR